MTDEIKSNRATPFDGDPNEKGEAGKASPSFGAETFEYPRRERVDVGGPSPVIICYERLCEIEADAFWCLGRLLDEFQDNYTPNQAGILRQIAEMVRVLERTNPGLIAHLNGLQVEPLQYAFRWMNCMLIREFPLEIIVRLWDAYLAEPDAFRVFHVYVCAAFLAHWESTLLGMQDFTDVILFLQCPPTGAWTPGDVEVLLAQAYAWRAMFG